MSNVFNELIFLLYNSLTQLGGFDVWQLLQLNTILIKTQTFQTDLFPLLRVPPHYDFHIFLERPDFLVAIQLWLVEELKHPSWGVHDDNELTYYDLTSLVDGYERKGIFLVDFQVLEAFQIDLEL